MEGVSGASAVASLVILGAKLAIQVHSFASKVQNAKSDVTHIASDLESLVSVLNKLEDALKNPTKRNVFNAMNDTSDFDRVADELTSIFKRFDVLMKKYDNIDQSKMQKYRWGFTGENEAIVLGRILVTHKTTLLLTLSLTNNLALSSIGEGIDNRLKQTEGNTEQILLEMREVITSQQQSREPASSTSKAQPGHNEAVRIWLEKAASHAGSVAGSDDIGDLRDFRTNIAMRTLNPPKQSAPTPHERVAQLNLPTPVAATMLQDKPSPPPQHEVNSDNWVSASEDMESRQLGKRRGSANFSETTGNDNSSFSLNTHQSTPKSGTTQVRRNHSRAANEAMFEQADLFREQGQFEKEESIYLKVMERLENRPEGDQKEYLNEMEHFGFLLKERKRLKEAERCLSRVLTAFKSRYGMTHRRTLLVAHTLASAYDWEDLSQASRSELLYKWAIEGYEQTEGPEFPRIFYSLRRLGELYYTQNKLDEAEHVLKRSLEGWRKVKGWKHPQTVHATTHLGRVYRKQNKNDEFEQLMKQGIEGFKESEAEGSLVCNMMYNLSLFYEQNNRLEEAEAIMKRALATYQTKRLRSWDSAGTLWALARIYEKQQKLEETEALYRNTLKTFEQTSSLGLRNRTALRHMIKLANFLKEQGRSDEAITMYEKAIPTFDALFGPRDATFRKGATGLARLYRQNGRPSEAEYMLSRATATGRMTSPSSLLNVPKDDNRSEISSQRAGSIRPALSSSGSDIENDSKSSKSKGKRPAKSKPPIPKLTGSSLATIAARQHSAARSEPAQQMKTSTSDNGVKSPQSEPAIPLKKKMQDRKERRRKDPGPPKD